MSMSTLNPPSSLTQCQIFRTDSHTLPVTTESAFHEILSPSLDPTGRPSPFLKLPSEIRNMIYTAVLTNENSIIELDEHQYLSHPLSESGLPTSKACCFCGEPKDPRPGNIPYPISFIRLCRKIYDETHLLPYTLNTFAVSPTRLLTFLHARTRGQLHSLRSLSIYARIYARSCDRNSFGNLRTVLSAAAAEELPRLKQLQLDISTQSGHERLKPSYARNAKALLEGLAAWLGRDLEVKFTVPVFDLDGDRDIAVVTVITPEENKSLRCGEDLEQYLHQRPRHG